MESTPLVELPVVDASSATELVEQELTVFMRRGRTMAAARAIAVHPDLRAGGYAVLLLVEESSDLRSSDLAERLGLDRSTISRVVAQLSGLGLIELAADDRDGRARFVRLSVEGAQRLEAAREVRRARFHESLSEWSADDLATLGRLVRRLNTDLGSERVPDPTPDR